jgi:serine/threonine-protein kinase HipA
VQEKLSLRFVGNNLTPTVTRGEFILKPIPLHEKAEHLEDIPANEHVSMLISKNIFKLDTAECGMIAFSDGELAYITKRFDYDSEGNKNDQEDFAAILGITSATDGDQYKYEGATYFDCANAIKNHVSARTVVLEEFFKRILLNYLIANGDGHLKNFALQRGYESDEYFLTPNYDVLNTKYHINEKYGDIACELFDFFTEEYMKIGYHSYHSFKMFADIINIPEKRFKKIMDFVNSSVEKVEEIVQQSFMSEEAKRYFIDIYKERVGRLNYRIDK